MSSPVTCQSITDTQTPYKALKDWVSQGGSITVMISGCGIQTTNIPLQFADGNKITFTTPTFTGQTNCTITLKWGDWTIFEAQLSNLSASNIYVLQVTYVLQ